jgi:diguanylate cyclase (GGDEF)-like protein
VSAESLDDEIASATTLKQRIGARLSAVFNQDLLPSRRQFDGDEFDQHMVRNRRSAYRYVLIALAVILAPINAYNYYTDRLLPAIAGVLVLFLFLSNIYLLARNREPFLSAPTVLLITLALVMLSLAYGQILTLYWLYPLLVALPVLLKTRAAVWLGILVGLIVTPFVWLRFDTGTAVIVCLSMAHTWLISAWLMYAVSEQSRTLSELAVVDALTGAFNRRHLQTRARDALKNWQRQGRPATLLLLDVDLFKAVNDDFGHHAGDKALCSIVEILKQRLRRLDLIFRYGGEEFVILLADTDESRATPVAEELRYQIEQANIIPGRQLTVSIGLCDVIQADSVDRWLRLSDKALYEAKLRGRNQVVIATPGAITATLN